ncbi:E3 ubiquitin-protein ligase TRIM39-like [Hoplias malabaricus]|uniref:E3 ubiquitin-protein ligase TRIM39-like n=1 Tax=Hoplias malabaricus TaxID=27720 RepID=UPI003462E1B2
MDTFIGISLEEQFKCCICLDVLTDPVSTPCGHNFCLVCIRKCWINTDDQCCPICKEKFHTKPELKVNTSFRSVVHYFQWQKGGGNAIVPCNVCSGQKLKAVKSCLDCGTSFCETHLENHKSAPRLIKHKLIDPVKNLDDYICPKHEKPLEQFCRDHQTCVCQFCNETDHRNDSTVSIEEESRERQTHLVKKQEDVQKMIEFRQKKIQEIQNSVKGNKESYKKSKAYSLEVFRSLVHCIERSQAELLNVMEEKQRAAERQAEDFIKELEQEIVELKKRDIELEQLSHTEDHLHLLRIYPSICSPLDTKNWTQARIDTQLSTKTLRIALSQLQESINKELKKLAKTVSKSTLHSTKPRKVSPSCTTTSSSSSTTANIKFGTPAKTVAIAIPEVLGEQHTKYAVNVTLDPNTAYPKLILSADGKQVWHGYTRQNVPNNPERFDTSACVLGKESFSSGRFYYEVQVTGKTMWSLGVVRGSIKRKGMISISPEQGYWTLLLRNETEYLALDNPSIRLSLKQALQKVGVFVDYEEGVVSFYDVEAKSHIYSYTGQSFTENLHTFFFPCNKEESSKPIAICPVTIDK